LNCRRNVRDGKVGLARERSVEQFWKRTRFIQKLVLSPFIFSFVDHRKVPYIYILYTNAAFEENLHVLYWYQLHINTSSVPTDSIKGILVYPLHRMFKLAENCDQLLYQCLKLKFLLLLKTLPTGSDMPAMAQTGCHLCCSFAYQSRRHLLSGRQVLGFGKTRKQTLQGNNWRLSDFKIMMFEWLISILFYTLHISHQLLPPPPVHFPVYPL
jgi:hypothetical protein